MQKFVCQSISTNTSYNPANGEIKMSTLLRDLLYAHQAGIKTLYYCQVNDMSGDDEGEDDDACGGACKV